MQHASCHSDRNAGGLFAGPVHGPAGPPSGPIGSKGPTGPTAALAGWLDALPPGDRGVLLDRVELRAGTLAEAGGFAQRPYHERAAVGVLLEFAAAHGLSAAEAMSLLDDPAGSGLAAVQRLARDASVPGRHAGRS